MLVREQEVKKKMQGVGKREKSVDQKLRNSSIFFAPCEIQKDQVGASQKKEIAGIQDVQHRGNKA